MSQAFEFKNDKILKPITIITLIYSVLMIIKYAGNLSGFVFKTDSPLIPKHLAYYVAFPAYFILPFLQL